MPERMEEFKRRITSGKAWGVEDMEIISPGEVKERCPCSSTKKSSLADFIRKVLARWTHCARAR